MPLTIEEVERIAKLARLELTEEEKVRYCGQLSAILDHVAKLQELNTASIPPTSSIFCSDIHPSDERSRQSLRRDEPRPGLPREELLKNAPEHEQGQFKIPPVFE